MHLLPWTLLLLLILSGLPVILNIIGTIVDGILDVVDISREVNK